MAGARLEGAARRLVQRIFGSNKAASNRRLFCREAPIPYIERDEAGNIVCLYNALAPEFQQARNYLSTGKLQERLAEYPAVHAEAARLGVSFDEAVADICARWPEWIDDADLARPAQIEEPHAANDAEPDEMGDHFDAGPDPGGHSGELPEAAEEPGDPGAADAGGGELGDDLEPAEVHSYPGMMIAGDALSSAKAIALMKVDDERYIRVGDYDKSANQARLDELRAIQQAIKEGVHPPFTDEQAEELQALETFLPFIQRIDDHAQELRNVIREAEDLDALAAIDLQTGWPE